MGGGNTSPRVGGISLWKVFKVSGNPFPGAGRDPFEEAGRDPFRGAGRETFPGTGGDAFPGTGGDAFRGAGVRLWVQTMDR